MLKRWLLLLAAMFAGGATAYTAPVGDAYYFSNLSLQDGLSQLSVLRICQDSKGYLWFGTRNGLNRYDGNRMTVYKHYSGDSLSLVHNHITALAEDRDRGLWVGTMRGLSRLDLQTDRFVSYADSEYPIFHSGVHALLVDSEARLWVGTGRGLFHFVPELQIFEPVDLRGEIRDEYISVLAETADHRLLIGTKRKGFYVCDRGLHPLAHYARTSGNGLLTDDDVSDLYEDAHGRLWVATNSGGLSKVDPADGTVQSFTAANSPLTTDNIRCLGESEGTLFVGTFDGLCTIDLATDRLQGRSNAAPERGNLSHFSIYSICVDNCGSVWIGTYSGGVNYLSKYNNRFAFHESSGSSDVLTGICGSMAFGAPDNLYIATEGGGLLAFDLRTGDSRSYLYDTSSAQTYSRNIVKSVLAEGDAVWCGTAQGELYRFDTHTRRFALWYTFPPAWTTVIYALLRAHDNSLWMATSKPEVGLVKLTADRQLQTRFAIAGSDEPWRPGSLRCLLELEPGVLLVGSRSNGLYKYDENRHTCTVYNRSQTGSAWLPSDYVTSIVRTAAGEIWVGTFGGGLSRYDAAEGFVQHVGRDEGLFDDEVCMIVEDDGGNLWMSTSSCISMYDPRTATIRNFRVGNGLNAQEFTPHSGTRLPDGRIGFSASNGFITFDPAALQLNAVPPPLVFTGLTVNNKAVTPAAGGLLSVVLDDAGRIELDYNQNNIAIGYCALNYVYPELNQYAYRLKGYDDEWIQAGNRKEAYFTKLEPGRYLFEVKAANNDGLWNEVPRTLQIVVRPPVWKTWYAWVFYAAAFFGICFLVMYYLIKKKNLEQALVYEQLKQQQNEEFHQTKLRMFTNFSHELRTPLTLIVSPLQELLQRTDLHAAVRNKLGLIHNNSQRLLLLVNQLMDLRKNQAGKMQLQIAKDDICSFLQEIWSAFNQIALGKQIDFRYECPQERIPAWFDKTLFEKVVFNLLSNAFKFTHAGGRIVLAIRRLGEQELPEAVAAGWNDRPHGSAFVQLTVSDTGKGIPEEEMQNIFALFYQIADKEAREVAGTGIGLSLTQSIVQLHHGTIRVENNAEGGASFHVFVPIDRSVYADNEIDRKALDRVVMDVIPSSTAPEAFDFERRYTLLLAEDNDEVRSYVRECLEPHFTVLEAADGATAFDLVVEHYPDLVVSDIMMPGKDGLELCREIKEDMRTGHIPVILMTARSMVMHIKEGFSSGADDYIVKPFDMDVLVYRIRNILVSREKLKRLYGKKFSPESIGIEIVSGDDKFTQQFFGIIEKHMANPELNIDLICREIGLSRTNLYRKLKAITELSPVELIRNKRLEIAARLLLESDYTVSEISTCVGFNSHAYFTQCFKMVYGCSPTEFLARQKMG